MSLLQLRRDYQFSICEHIPGFRGRIPNIADKGSPKSIEFARGIIERIGFSTCANPPTGQQVGAFFEAQTRDFLDKAFGLISHLRPGEWKFSLHGC